MLQPEIQVETAGMVLLDDENSAGRIGFRVGLEGARTGLVLDGGKRFGGPLRIALVHVAGQPRVQGRAPDGGADAGRAGARAVRVGRAAVVVLGSGTPVRVRSGVPARHRGEGVLSLFDALHDGREVQMLELGGGEFAPRPRAATMGWARPRREYGTMVVLFPLFWLQSTSTLPLRRVFFMSLTTRSGWSASSERANSCANAETCSHLRVPSSPA